LELYYWNLKYFDKILDTGNIDTIGSCCLGNAGTFFGLTSAITLISLPDKA
jgi:hypothetical protein